MLRGASIICLSSIDWAFNRQNPQELAVALAEGGNRVLFVENTGVRRVALRDASRLWTRVRNWWRSRGDVESVAEGIDVHAPVLLPLPYSRVACAINVRLLLRVVRRWRRADPADPLIVITFLPTPLARALIAALAPDLVVYYCIDRLAESSPGARPLRHYEPAFFAEVDLVVVTSENLRANAARSARRVEMLPSGVRVEDFQSACAPGAVVPPAMAGLEGPVIGFVGSLRGATDLALLARVADLAPDLNFVLIGPRFVDVREFATRRNVRLIEAVPHRDVMRYMARFDVGILPYVLDAFTAAVMPVKLKEYLAAALPVVSTPLPEVLRFAQRHPQMVSFAGNADDFVAAIRAAIVANTPAARTRRLDVARRYDWRNQMATLGGWMEELMTNTGRSSDRRRL